MSRQIKFRVWDREKRYFWYPKNYGTTTFEEVFDTERAVLEQFTGLKDKNGKEIYEGDILKLNIKDTPDINNNLKWKVEYFDDLATYGTTSGNCFQTFEDILKDDDVDWELEVVGNILETPELLKYDRA